MLRRFPPHIRDTPSDTAKSIDATKEMQNAVLLVSAAQTGRLRKLKMVLDSLSKDEAKKLTNRNVNGTTPLVVAARNGHLDVVHYLVDHGADIEQTGQVTFDGETIEDAPPLWCASAAGHFDIVKFLVRKGALVNHTTKTNSTPLRAACFDGHFQIVQFLVLHGSDIEIANRHGHTCLMISCYKGHLNIAKYLLEHNACIDRRSTKGNTALHDCAESGSLDIMKLLFDYKAVMQPDVYGMTPLTAASVTGHTVVVEYLVGRADCTSRQRVEALELLGATYVDKKRDLLTALHYWKRAMAERWHVGGDLLPRQENASLVKKYEVEQAVETVEDMDELITSPDDMRMYALLIREKILGAAHPDTSYYIRYRGAVYADTGDFDRCIYLWSYALDMQMSMLEPLNPMTQSSLLSFAELFSYMLSEDSHLVRPRRPPGTRERVTRPARLHEIIPVLDRTLHELQKGTTHYVEGGGGACEGGEAAATWKAYYDRLITIAMHFVSLMCKIRHTLTPPQDEQMRESVKRLLALERVGSERWSPLHYACYKGTTWVGKYPVQSFPSNNVTRLLLECGASVNATDSAGSTPLITAAQNDTANIDVMVELLEHGAHLDHCNAAGRSAPDYLTAQQMVQINSVKYTRLACLAARCLRRHGVAYAGVLPTRLAAFTSQHSQATST